MDQKRYDHLLTTYRDGLLQDTVPFWVPRAIDKEFGGYTTLRLQNGDLLDTDKSIWFQGRFSWTLSTLYNQVEQNPEWLAAAKSGLDFLRKHGFDTDGRMFFHVEQDGTPIRKRRYFFSECFMTVALAAYAHATSDAAVGQEAEALLKKIIHLIETPGALEPKLFGNNRPSKALVVPMILLNVAQEVRKASGSSWVHELAEDCYKKIKNDFMNHEHKAVLESVAPDNGIIDHIDGRMLNPGHSIEAAWFIFDEAVHRDHDQDMIQTGCTIIDWMWEWGWDTTHGGILYYRDVMNKPPQEYWHDMKFWWNHNEVIIATLYAYYLTADKKYLDMHTQVHDWAYAHFPDKEHGEWFGYLLRDGTISNTAKGTIYKGPFHLPRMQIKCWKLLEMIKQKGLIV